MRPVPPDSTGGQQTESQMNESNAVPAAVVRLPEVVQLTGRKRSSIYEDMAAGRMPRSIKLGPRSVGWLRADIEAWIAARVAERDGTAGAAA